MKKKLFFLLIGCMLVASGLYAQSSEFVLDEEEETVVVPVDTTTVQPVEIQITPIRWDELNGPMENLKQAIVDLANEPNKRTVTRDKIAWIYKVYDVPTVSGNQTVYLSVLQDAPYGYFLSKQNPNEAETICECYLELERPEKVSITGNETPSKHQTDDTVHFGKTESNGPNSNIKDLW